MNLHDPDQTKTETFFNLKIVDPCTDSTVNSDNELVLDSLNAPDDVSVFESKLYEAPNNSAELEFSDYTICGPLIYSFLTED